MRFPVGVLREERAELRLRVELRTVVDAAIDVDRRARNYEHRLFYVYIHGLRAAVFILDDDAARNGERSVEPDVNDQPAVRFDGDALDAEIDLRRHALYAEARRILVRRADTEARFGGIGAHSERGDLRAALREVIYLVALDVPLAAFVEFFRARLDEQFFKFVYRLERRRRVVQKLHQVVGVLSFSVHFSKPFRFSSI